MRTLNRLELAVALCMSAALTTPAWAVDGVIEINQARAAAGGVTPSDTPGFPVTIDHSGSYRLTGNLDVTQGVTAAAAANITAIDITADNVTVDLNGFAIIGPVTCSGTPLSCTPTGTGRGIKGKPSNVVINGAVRGMGSDGISLQTGSRVEAVQASNNGSSGIALQGANFVVTRCVATGNGFNGISSGGGAIIGNAANDNGNDGIFGGGLQVNGNTAQNNGGDGIAATGSNMVGNNSTFNTGRGISGSFSCGYANNVLANNAGGNVTGCVQTGGNICDMVLCP